jgi:hypothetical protein
MKQVASKGRILLRKILTGLSLGAVAVTFQACYGMPPSDVSLSGKVKSTDTEEPILGIRVSSSNDRDLTDSSGNYRLLVKDRIQTVLFEDIDGALNGEFHDKEVRWDPSDGPLNVSLDPK